MVGLTTGWNAGRLPARCLELKETDILSIQQARMGVRSSGKDMESSRKAPGCPSLPGEDRTASPNPSGGHGPAAFDSAR